MKKRIYKLMCALLSALLMLSALTETAVAVGDDVKISSRFIEMFFGKEEEAATLNVGGVVFGAKIQQSYATVTEAKSVPKLRAGDIIISVDGKDVKSAAQIEQIVKSCGGKTLKIIAKRGDVTIITEAKPTLSSSDYKLGIKVKDSATGIGTLTFYDPETGLFGGLGHGICDPDTGELIPTVGGDVTGVLLGGVHKGEAGKPGELSGVLTGKVFGKITCNTECGIFGTLEGIDSDDVGDAMPVGKRDDVHTGCAEIISTVKNGDARRFSVEITEIEDGGSLTKCFRVKVTDPTLIAITGGIVRGMSGSPIIQDGKLIGALTHVMVGEPTEGYGIFIENMLKAAKQEIQPKAA